MCVLARIYLPTSLVLSKLQHIHVVMSKDRKQNLNKHNSCLTKREKDPNCPIIWYVSAIQPWMHTPPTKQNMTHSYMQSLNHASLIESFSFQTWMRSYQQVLVPQRCMISVSIFPGTCPGLLIRSYCSW